MKVCVQLGDQQLSVAGNLDGIFPKIVLPVPDPNYDPIPWRKEGQLPQSGLFESRVGQGPEIKGTDASLITEENCKNRIESDAEDKFPENGNEDGEADGKLSLEKSKDAGLKSDIQLVWEDQEPSTKDFMPDRKGAPHLSPDYDAQHVDPRQSSDWDATKSAFENKAAASDKEEPKGILYDAFCALMEENRIRLKRPQVAVARDEPKSKDQHEKQRDHVQLNAEIKTAQDAVMKKRQQLNTLQKKLSEMRAPKNSKNGANFAKRRQQVVAKIKEVRDSIRASNQRIMDLREER